MDRFRLAVFNTQPPHLYFGGVERRIIETGKRLQNKIDVTVYAGTKAGFKTPTEIDGVRLVPCPSTDRIYPLDNYTFNRSLTKHAQKIVADADLIEAHVVSGYGFPIALRKLGAKKPIIHTIHGVLADEYEQGKLYGDQAPRGRMANYFMGKLGRLDKETAHHAALIVTISQYSLHKIQSHYGINAGKVRIVPNGVDIEKFKPVADVAPLKRKLGLGGEPCVLFVGSLIPRKGLPYLIQAAQTVIKTQPNTKFLLVGDGPLKPQLQASLQATNLQRNFQFVGNLSEADLAAIYNCADLFVLPSVQEGQGIVLLEAQASGVPVVAFGVGGVTEAVRDGETGLLAAGGDTAGLADALLRLLSDEALRKRMGAAGRRFVMENYTWDLCAERMLAVYREALGY
jgi:glycosyltransferase involved in cell wall biosynthesis